MEWWQEDKWADILLEIKDSLWLSWQFDGWNSDLLMRQYKRVRGEGQEGVPLLCRCRLSVSFLPLADVESRELEAEIMQ